MTGSLQQVATQQYSAYFKPHVLTANATAYSAQINTYHILDCSSSMKDAHMASKVRRANLVTSKKNYKFVIRGLISSTIRSSHFSTWWSEHCVLGSHLWWSSLQHKSSWSVWLLHCKDKYGILLHHRHSKVRQPMINKMTSFSLSSAWGQQWRQANLDVVCGCQGHLWTANCLCHHLPARVNKILSNLFKTSDPSVSNVNSKI